MSYDRQAFEKNYKYLMGNMSGAWFSGVFSKGDEAKMKEALMEIAKTPEGREIISQLPPNFQISSTRSLPDNFDGFYRFDENDITLNTSSPIALTSSVLFHEMRHAVQQNHYDLGISNKGYSAEQAICIDKLTEAETAAWERAMYASTKNPQWKTTEVNKNDMQLYNTCLKQCNGNEEKARKMMVGKLIPQYMSVNCSNQSWVATYNLQAVNNTLDASRQGHITTKGNNQEFNRVLDYYTNEYGIDKIKISKSNIYPTLNHWSKGAEIEQNARLTDARSQIEPPILPKRYTNENNIRKDLSQSLGGLSNKEWQNIRKSLDSNNDGKLDNDELRGVYQMLDLNKDGNITRADIKSAGGRNEVMDTFRLIAQESGRC